MPATGLHSAPRAQLQAQASSAEIVEAGLAALPPGDAAGGESVFAGNCRACHSLDPDARLAGPSLAGIAARAATRRPGYSAEMYVYESIVSPNAYVVEGFHGDIMPAGFKQRLSAQELADLLAFLMTR
jgi:nitric oxide reductase subunit C